MERKSRYEAQKAKDAAWLSEPARDDFNGGYTLASVSTDAVPGTPDKVAVLAARAQAGVSLFHPRDGKRDVA